MSLLCIMCVWFKLQRSASNRRRYAVCSDQRVESQLVKNYLYMYMTVESHDFRSPGGRYSPSERRPSSGDRRPSSADRHPSSADRGTPPSGRHTSQERTPRDERDLVRERRPSSREAREKKVFVCVYYVYAREAF